MLTLSNSSRFQELTGIDFTSMGYVEFLFSFSLSYGILTSDLVKINPENKLSNFINGKKELKK